MDIEPTFEQLHRKEWDNSITDDIWEAIVALEQRINAGDVELAAALAELESLRAKNG